MTISDTTIKTAKSRTGKACKLPDEKETVLVFLAGNADLARPLVLHALLDLADDKFCLLRQKCPSRKRLFDDTKALTTTLCFDSREHLLDFMLEDWSYKPGSPINRLPKPEIG